MTKAAADEGSYDGLAKGYLETFVAALRDHGVDVDPALSIEVSSGLVSYYDLAVKRISVAVPRRTGPGAALQMLYLRTLLGYDTVDEVEELLAFSLPIAVAHELGHHLRHRYGRFGSDLWREEQIANLFASALQKRRYSPAERRRGVELIGRAMAHLSPELSEAVTDTYGSLLAALEVAGMISDATVSSLALIQKYVPASDASTPGAELLPVDVLRRVGHRQGLTQTFTAEYSRDVARYSYYQLGWLFISLSSPESHHLATLAREHLGVGPAPLGLPPPGAPVEPQALAALYEAGHLTRARSPAAARYFHLRYRDCLLAVLANDEATSSRGLADAAKNLSTTALHVGTIEEDPLDILVPLAPLALRRCFPSVLAAEPRREPRAIAEALPALTDRRLLEHVALGADDADASTMLDRLALLFGLQLFDRLPPHEVVSLAESLPVLHARPGQLIVWEDDNDRDLFCIHRGQVEVLESDGSRRALIGPGEVFGEMQYLLRQRRTKSVRVIEETVCVVIPERELSFLIYRHPEVGLQIARSLARRLMGR